MSPSPCLTSTARRAACAVLVALGLTVVVLAGSTGAGAAPAQVPHLLDAGTRHDDPEPPQLEHHGPEHHERGQGATSTTSGSNSSSSDDAADDNRRVWYVVAALVAVALALTGLTIWYWFRTRPTAAGRRAAGTSTGRHGRAGAPLDHDLPPEDTTAAPVDAGTDREQTPARGTAAVDERARRPPCRGADRQGASARRATPAHHRRRTRPRRERPGLGTSRHG